MDPAAVDFAALKRTAIAELSAPLSDAKLLALCTLLRDQHPLYDWVGFYWVDPTRDRMLVVGPYAGEVTEHTEIPFGKGICGQSAERQATVLVQDVAKADNYLACSLATKSELVVPVMKDGTYLGQIDIDSHTLNAFTPEDQTLLEAICARVAELR